MRTRLALLVGTVASLSAAVPALADCLFDDASETIDLHPVATPLEPYRGDFTTTGFLDLDRACSTVFIEIPDILPLRRTGSTTGEIPLTLRPTGDAIMRQNGIRRLVELPAGSDGLAFTLTTGIGNANGLPSGTYEHTAKFRMYSDIDRNTELDMANVTFRAEVKEVMTLSLSGPAGAKVDLGMLSEGTTTTNTSMTLRAVSNNPHRITFDSRNGWKIVQNAEGDGKYEIPYTLDVAGQRLSGDAAELSRLDPTDAAGDDRLLKFTVTPRGNLRSGFYEDEITITIIGEAGS